MLEKYFAKISDALFSQLQKGEELNLNLAAEEQTYARFNRALLRQTTAVLQREIELAFQSHGRKVSLTISLQGEEKEDLPALTSLLERARHEASLLPADPFLVPVLNHGQSRQHHSGKIPTAQECLRQIAETARGSDLAGLFAAGPMIRANRNSLGQSHWFSTESFFFDYSLFTVNDSGENKAVKGVYADSQWSTEMLREHLQRSRRQLELLQRPTQKIKPGHYRTFLGPGAMAEICSMLSWNAFSYGAMKKGDCAFTKLYEGERTLSPKFSLKENFKLGLVPSFNGQGEMSPEELVLVENGSLKNMLISSRAAQEFGVISNGAESGSFGWESLRSPEISPGQLKEAEILATLGTGLYLSHLHYLNWSDVSAARVTGMTRYACFWVEKGEIAGPIQDLRFDESLYRLFGAELIDLTQAPVIEPEVGTYNLRSLGGKKLPGALVGTMAFTL
jgi:predicted Zn-dependent protease